MGADLNNGPIFEESNDVADNNKNSEAKNYVPKEVKLNSEDLQSLDIESILNDAMDGADVSTHEGLMMLQEVTILAGLVDGSSKYEKHFLSEFIKSNTPLTLDNILSMTKYLDQDSLTTPTGYEGTGNEEPKTGTEKADGESGDISTTPEADESDIGHVIEGPETEIKNPNAQKFDHLL